MTETYTPDNWVIVRIPHEDKHIYKVVAGWSGGYLHGDSWRVNSGIIHIEDCGDSYRFHGESGSVYKCRKDCEFERANIHGVLNTLRQHGAVVIKVGEMK